MYSFPYLEPVCCSMSSSNFCFLTCIQIFQEAGQVVWYSHLFKNFPEFVVVHTVKGFGIVNKAEINIFLELSCFFHDPTAVGNLISGSSAFSKSSLNTWKFTVHVLLKRLLFSDNITACCTQTVVHKHWDSRMRFLEEWAHCPAVPFVSQSLRRASWSWAVCSVALFRRVGLWSVTREKLFLVREEEG